MEKMDNSNSGNLKDENNDKPEVQDRWQNQDCSSWQSRGLGAPGIDLISIQHQTQKRAYLKKRREARSSTSSKAKDRCL